MNLTLLPFQAICKDSIEPQTTWILVHRVILLFVILILNIIRRFPKHMSVIRYTKESAAKWMALIRVARNLK